MKTQLVQNSHVSYDFFNNLKMKVNSIVVVDDSIIDNFICKKVFELHDCRNIKIFCYYTQAIKYLESIIESPDLIIVNLDMPYNSGFDFIDKLKKTEMLNKNTLLIATVSSGLPSIYLEATERNLNLIEKPITYNKVKDFLFSKN